MKNKEFVKGVKGYGYSIVDFEVVYAIFSEFGYLIAYVSKVTQCEFELYYKKELGRELFSLIVVYSATPIEDRDEEKKFYLRHRWMGGIPVNYLNISLASDDFFLDDKNENFGKKTAFTRKEIEEIKETHNTDLSDFKEVEVKDD